SKQEGGAADAHPTVNRNSLSFGEPFGQGSREGPQIPGRRRDVAIGNRMRDELKTVAACQRAFLLQSEENLFLRREHRDENIDALILQRPDLVLQPVAAPRTRHHRQTSSTRAL